MINKEQLISALWAIDPASLTYAEWIKVGMACKAAGLPLSEWESWSKQDPRYKTGECVMKWQTFSNDGGITAGTLVKMAQTAGWKAPQEKSNPEAWISYVESATGEKYVDRYDYSDLSGRYHHTKIRTRKPDGDKHFIQGWMRDEKFIFASKKNGRPLTTKGTVFGSISSIQTAIEQGEKVFLPEGEKDVRALISKGFTAVTYGSAESWDSSLASLFDGADVIILGDNDGDGRKVVSKIKRDLEGHAKTAKVIFPSNQQKGDISDFFAAGGTVEELQQMIDGPDMMDLEEVEEDPEAVEELHVDGVALEFERPGKPKQTIGNVIEVLEHDPNLKGVLKYNVLSHSACVKGHLPWEVGEVDREFSNFDYSNLRAYLERGYRLTSVPKIDDALMVVESRHQFNPVIDRLSDIYAGWNHQTGYIENLLPDYLGVEKTEYATQVMTLTMLGAISRVYRPGCKFDYMTVLVGKQGIGKSSFFRCLALNPEWYCDNFATIEGDKASEKLRGFWICEMAELLATKRAKDVEAIKSFLTSQTDSYRPPYERLTEHRQRMCIFVGTTNNEQFLTDMTGNRRFLPLICRPEYIKKDLFEDPEQVEKDFVNAWGEALDIFWKAGGKPALVLSKNAAVVAEQMQENATEEDPRVGMIQDWLDHTDKDLVCACMICREVLGDIGTPPKSDSYAVGSILRNKIHGWKRVPGKVRCGEYGAQNCYRRSVDTAVDTSQISVDTAGFRPVVDADKVPFD